MTAADAYRALNLPPGANASDVRQAYLDLVKVWHPDRFEHDDRLRQKTATHLAEINEAYALLRGTTSPSVGTRAADQATSPADPRSTPSAEPRPSQPVRSSRRRRVVVAAVMAAAALVALGVILTKPGTPRTATVGGETDTAVTDPSRKTMVGDPASAPSEETSASARAAGRDESSARRAPETVRPPDDRSPESGTDVRPVSTRGHAPLSMTNATGADGLVLLSPGAAGSPESDSQTVTRVIFIRRGEKATLLDLAPGDYRVRLVLGADWQGTVFARPSAHFARASVLTLVDGPADVATSLTLTRGGEFAPIAPFPID